MFAPDEPFQPSPMLGEGNCDIGQKILFVNETKWYEIWSRPKGGAQNIVKFQNFSLLLWQLLKIYRNISDSFECRKFETQYKSGGKRKKSQYHSYLVCWYGEEAVHGSEAPIMGKFTH